MTRFAKGPGGVESDAYVFHYTSAETALNYILASNTLRMGPLAAVNDPRESKLFGFTYLPENMLRGRITSGEAIEFHTHDLEKRSICDEASALFRKRIKVLCFSRDTKSRYKEDPGYYSGFARPSLWAHYGGNHTGVCLVFDRQQLLSDISHSLNPHDVLAFGNVRYPASVTTLRERSALNLDLDEISRIGLIPSLVKKFRRYSAELCLRKHPDWRSEQEWRILLYGPGEDFKFIDISESLRGIVLGASFDMAAWRRELEDSYSRLAVCLAKLEFHQLTGRGFGSPQFLPPTKTR